MKKTTVVAALLVAFFGASTWLGLSYANDSAASATAQAETATVELAVQKMYCAVCPITLQKALERVEGTIDAHVDFEAKLAKVTYDPQLTNVAELIKATTDAGYPSAPVR